MAKKQKLLPKIIDLDTLLYGNPTWEQVVQFYKEGEFCEEQYQVASIKKHLRTPEQKKILDEADLSIEDLLNGRYSKENEIATVSKCIVDWNAKLGFNYFTDIGK